jgi:diketogulonate reductase-like aldo/keto reductase
MHLRCGTVDDTIPARELPGGVRMPLLGVGVYKVPPGQVTEQVVRCALDVGYRHVDTAALYENEESVGAALRASGLPREDVFVTTKLLPPRAPVLGRDAGSLLEASLKRLGLDHVDLYLIHWPNRWAKSQWKALRKAQERGLARNIGVSNYGVAQLQELLSWDIAVPAVNQVSFNPFAYRRALREFCEERGIVFEAYASLTQSHRIDDPTVARIAAEHRRTPAQVLLRWAVQRDVVVIPKSLREERIRENARIFDFELSVMDMGALDTLDETGGTGEAL